MAQSIFMKRLRDSMGAIFLIVAILFVGMMVFDWGMNITGRRGQQKRENVIAIVDGKTKIDIGEYQKEIDAQMQLAQQQGRIIDDFFTEDVKEYAWQAIINRNVLKQELEKKLVNSATDDEINRSLILNPPDWIKDASQFQTNGKFDYNKYVQIISSGMIDLSPVIGPMQHNLPYDKLKILLSTTSFITVNEAMDEYAYRNTKFRGEYMIIGGDCGPVPVDTSERALKEYYEKHKDSLVVHPYFVYSYVEIPYLPTKRDSAETKEQVDTVMSLLARGEDFEMLASSYSHDPRSAANNGDLGWFRRGQLTHEFEKTAFALDSGEISKPVLTEYGWHIIRSLGKRILTDTLSGKIDTLVHAQHILFRIEPGYDTYDSIENFVGAVYDLAEKKGLANAAKEFGLELKYTSKVRRDEAIPEIGMRTMLNQFAFTHKIGAIPEIVKSQGKAFVLQLEEVALQSFGDFEHARYYLVRHLLEQAKQKKCYEVALAARQKIKGGAKMKDVAREIGATYDTTGTVGMLEQMGNETFDPWVSGAMFGLNDMDSLSAVISDGHGKYYIVKLWQRTKADMTKFTQEAEPVLWQLFKVKRDNAYSQWLTNLRQSKNIKDFRLDYFGGESEELPEDTSASN